MKKMKRLLAIALALVMVLALLPSTALAATPAEKNVTAVAATDKGLAKGFKSETFLRQNSYQYADSQIVHAIVTLNGDAAIKADNAKRAATRAALAIQHANVRSAISAQKISYTVEFDYDTLLNGMAIRVAYGDLEKIAALSGVNSVHIANEYKLPEDEINMESSNQMTGIAYLQEGAVYGSGTVVAVIDTGLNYNHEAFQPYEGMLENAVLNEQNVPAETYLNQKVPFAYDYADGDTDVTDIEGHGTHVAGIATGFAMDETDGTVLFSGSAPDAQLLAMKVFSDEESTTNSGIYFAALEDAYNLGADVINMSIGSPAGFTYDSELEDSYFGNIYQMLDNAGVLVAISAGNETSQAANSSSWFGRGYVTSDYTDYGIIGSPSTYDGNTSVASAVNASYHAFVAQVFDGAETLNIPYNDSTENGKVPEILGGQEDLQYVSIPGVGNEEDFDGIDVDGKIALISRGEINYTDKILNAEAVGAIGVICYDHTEEALMGMLIEDTSIPAMFISKADGEALVALSEIPVEGSEEVTYEPVDIFFPQTDMIFDNDTAWLMSDFSSWGCTNDLRLKPTITGIGTNVWSADTNDDHGYVDMSGTSMSSPDVAGCYASLLSIGRENYPEMGKQEMAKILEDLTESTAYVLTDDYDYEYSPRQQGAGLIAVDYAARSSCYIEDPIKNLYDSTDGKFSFDFVVRSLYNEAVTYTLDPTVLCDYLELVDAGSNGELDIHYYNSLTSDYLSEYGDYIFDCPEEITVPANGEITVSVSIEMSENLMQTLDETFPNGTFIEGYLHLTNVDSYNSMTDSYDEDFLHATFMGFYGDWTQAPILEKADWRDIVDIENWLASDTAVDIDGVRYEDLGYTYLNFMDKEINTDVSLAYLLNDDFEGGYAGDNAFYYNDYEYNPDRIAVTNSDSDSFYMGMLYMEPSTLRNAQHIIMVVTDAETGEIYTVDDTEYVPKSTYDEDYAAWMNNSSFIFDGTKTYGVDEPENLPNGTKVSIDYYANLAYGEDELGSIGYAFLKEQGQKYLVWNINATVDTQAPEFDDITVEDGVLSFTVTDNEYAAGVQVYDNYFEEIDGIKIEENAAGATTQVSFEIGDEYPIVYLAAQDYASNEGICPILLDETPLTLTLHVPEGIEVDGESVISGVYGDSIILPSVTGEIAPYEFIAWVPEEVEETDNYDGDEYYFDGDEMMLEASMDLYAMFDKPDGYYDPTEELDIIMESRDDWTGTYAIDGYNWDTDDDYILGDDGTAVNCYENDITVEYYMFGFAYMYGTPESAIFDIAALDEEGTYSIASVNTGKYLALGEDGITFIDELTDAAAWVIGYDEDFSANVIMSASNPDTWLVFDTADQTFKAVEASIYDYDDPYNLYLFGLADKYVYTTTVTPCTHEWELSDETCFMETYTCAICGEIRTETKQEPEHDFIKDSETCTTITYQCLECSEVLTELKSEPTHTFVVDEQTCTAIISKCSVCGETKTEEKATAEHNWAEVAEGSSCFTKGYECSVCGETKMELKSEPTHTFVVDDQTCTAIIYKCSVCGETKTEAKTSANHNWAEVTEGTSCFTKGYKCSVCGETKMELKSEPTHTFVKQAETCTEITYKCSACGMPKTEGKNPDTHKWEKTDETATSIIYTCSVCKQIKEEAKQTCTHTWVMESENYFFINYKCSLCGETKSVEKTEFDTSPAEAFDDVKDGAWYVPAINFVVSQDYFKGLSTDIFAPDTIMNRAMLVTVLYRMEGEPKVTFRNVFTDVPDNKWYSDAIVWAASDDVGVVDGIGGGLFAPDQSVTREQIAMILFRYAKYKGLDTANEGDLSDFTDSCSGYAKQAMTWAVGKDIITGIKNSDGTYALKAKDGGTRAQVATMLMRFFKSYPELLPLMNLPTPAAPTNPT